MLKHITAVAVLSLTLAAPAAAQVARAPAGPANRPARMLALRIRAGVRSGQITRAELAVIRQRLRAFRSEVRQMRTGGTLSREDRQTIRRDWRRLNRLVFRARHR
jgi:Ni/Co efflux regulator RcnB